jgi:uncharacterized damage-inducible protein DinB
MKPVEWARTLAAYNRWMNERLYALCADLPDPERKRDRGAFFRSIHGTLNHLLLADRIWLGRFTGVPFEVASLGPADFERALRYTSVVNPAPRSVPFWAALTHFFNHQAHHRGQLTTLLMQAGVDPGVTDLIWLPELQPKA